MHQPDPAKAILVLDAMLEFFSGGENWTRHSYKDRCGRRCLIGALHHIRGQFGVRGDGTLDLLHRALLRKKQRPLIGSSTSKTLQPYQRLMHFNDRRATSYDEVRALIRAARAIAQAELGAKRPRTTKPTARIAARCDSPAREYEAA